MYINKRNLIIITFLLISFIFLFKLGSGTLWDNDEPTYSQIAKNMAESGNYITPFLQDRNWFCHPPLYFAITAAIGKAFGFTEFWMRLPSAIFGILAVWAVFLLGSVLFDWKIGLFAAIIQASSLQYIVQSRMAILDTCFCFLLWISLYFFWKAYKEKAVKYYYFAGIITGIAVMVKGPFALAYPLAIIAPLFVFRKNFRKNFSVHIAWSFLIAVLIGSIWYIFETIKFGREFTDPVFVYFLFKRIKMPIMNQAGAWWYYIPFIFLGLFPWSAFLPFSLYRNLKNSLKEDKELYLCIWFWFMFLFFSFIGTKLPNYMLFLYPACALSIALWINDVYEKQNFSLLKMAHIALLLVIGFVIFAFYYWGTTRFPVEFNMVKNNLILPFSLLFIGVLLSFFLVKIKVKDILPAPIIILAVSCAVFFLSIYIGLSPVIEQSKPFKSLSYKLKSNLIKSDKIIFYDAPGSFSLVFYSELDIINLRTVKEVLEYFKNNSNNQVYFITTKKNYDEIKSMNLFPMYVLLTENQMVLCSNYPEFHKVN